MGAPGGRRGGRASTRSASAASTPTSSWRRHPGRRSPARAPRPPPGRGLPLPDGRAGAHRRCSPPTLPANWPRCWTSRTRGAGGRAHRRPVPTTGPVPARASLDPTPQRRALAARSRAWPALAGARRGVVHPEPALRPTPGSGSTAGVPLPGPGGGVRAARGRHRRPRSALPRPPVVRRQRSGRARRGRPRRRPAARPRAGRTGRRPRPVGRPQPRRVDRDGGRRDVPARAVDALPRLAAARRPRRCPTWCTRPWAAEPRRRPPRWTAWSGIAVSHDNCPHQSVICGAPEPLAEAAAQTRRRRAYSAQELPFRSGFHTPMWAPYLASGPAPPSAPCRCGPRGCPYGRRRRPRPTRARPRRGPAAGRCGICWSRSASGADQAAVRGRASARSSRWAPAASPGSCRDTLHGQDHLAVAAADCPPRAVSPNSAAWPPRCGRRA